MLDFWVALSGVVIIVRRLIREGLVRDLFTEALIAKFIAELLEICPPLPDATYPPRDPVSTRLLRNLRKLQQIGHLKVLILPQIRRPIWVLPEVRYVVTFQQADDHFGYDASVHGTEPPAFRPQLRFLQD